MIELDGSIGYGQVLRTAIALACLTLKPVKIFNIRKGRPRPGLMPQHLKGVQVAAEFCNAELKGAKLRSMSLEFKPKYLDVPSEKTIDVGTAGSLTLLLQTLLPIILFSGKSTKLVLIGGTDVRGSPTVNYFKKAFLKYLNLMGARVNLDVIRHGFYPRGGGKLKLEVATCKSLKPVRLVERGDLLSLDAFSVATANLQKAKVAERQLRGFEENIDLKLNNQSFMYVDALSTGTSFYAQAVYENCILAADGVGERRKRSEDVGKEVAIGLKASIESNACLDKFMSDQLIPFLALANGWSEVRVERLTQHLRTNIMVCEVMLGVKFRIKDSLVRVRGVGFG